MNDSQASPADNPVGSVGSSEATVRSHIAAQGRAQDARDMAEAMSHAVLAVELSRQLGDPGLLADALVCRATVLDGIGNCDQALQDLETARAALDAAGRPTTVRFHNVLADVYNTLRRWDDAIEACRDAVSAARHAGDELSQALSLVILAAFLSDAVEAEDEAKGARDPRDPLPTRSAQATNRLEEAHRACSAAHELLGTSPAPYVRPCHNSTLGGVLFLQGRHAAANAMLQAQADIAAECNEEASLTWAHRIQARLHLACGDDAAALRHAQAALENAERLRQRRDEAKLHGLLSTIHEARGDLREALQSLKRSQQVEREMATAATTVRSDVLGVQMRTEAARREAATERERADALRRSNLALERQAKTLSREAMEDPLTGLANRRFVDAYLAQHAPLAASGTERACVGLLDIDHFKRVNDDFSHAVGDRVLQIIGALLRRHCRMKDLAGRYGGEEFVMCWSGVELNHAARLCERLRLAVLSHDWHTVAPGLHVTVSIGLVDLARHETAGAALAAADALLYDAKARGRNQVRASAA